MRPIGHRERPGRWVAACAVALVFIALPILEAALAQPSAQWFPAVAAPGDEVNLFADWTPTEPSDGLTIDVRDGWDVVAVEAVILGRNDRVEFSLRRTVQGIFAESDQRLFGRLRLIVTLRAPDQKAVSTLSVVPSVIVDDTDGTRLEPLSRHEIEIDVAVEELSSSSGAALRLDVSNSQSFEIDASGVLDSPETTGLTVAFWIKSVDLGQVVISSWDGRDHVDYPFEFVVERDGEMRIYAGEAGMHYSLGSSRPIADGGWHHVAYSVNASDGLAFMTIDGVEVDSRFLPGTDELELRSIAIGGRLTQPARFNGTIDEILIVPEAMTADQIARVSRVPVDAVEFDNRAMSFGFDTRRARRAVSGANPEVDFVASDLTLHEPVTDVVAEFRPGRVLLNWRLERPEPQVMTVERSRDGLVFDEIHEVRIRDADLELMQPGQPFSFEDFVPDDARVSFYRIHQKFSDHSEIESAMIKVGMGALELPTAIELVGNSPNPFSTNTEVYYRVHEPTQMRLSVWSVSGHLAEVLVNEMKEPGLHRVPFSPGDLPSGTYFVRLESAEGVQTGKMILRR